jgi:hypothetical protein
MHCWQIQLRSRSKYLCPHSVTGADVARSRALMWLGHGRRGIMICCRTARMVGGNYDKVRLSIETDRGTPTPLPITTPYSALTVGNREQHTTITLMEPPYGWARPTPSVPHQLQCSIGFRPRATANTSAVLNWLSAKSYRAVLNWLLAKSYR